MHKMATLCISITINGELSFSAPVLLTLPNQQNPETVSSRLILEQMRVSVVSDMSHSTS
jgi:hypothetical protein